MCAVKESNPLLMLGRHSVTPTSYLQRFCPALEDLHPRHVFPKHAYYSLYYKLKHDVDRSTHHGPLLRRCKGSWNRTKSYAFGVHFVAMTYPLWHTRKRNRTSLLLPSSYSMTVRRKLYRISLFPSLFLKVEPLFIIREIMSSFFVGSLWSKSITYGGYFLPQSMQGNIFYLTNFFIIIAFDVLFCASNIFRGIFL